MMITETMMEVNTSCHKENKTLTAKTRKIPCFIKDLLADKEENGRNNETKEGKIIIKIYSVPYPTTKILNRHVGNSADIS